MKFTDGCWLMRPGVEIAAPAQAWDVSVTDVDVRILAPGNAIQHRGATLSGPVFNVRLSSPLDDVVRVSLSHFLSGESAEPRFALRDDSRGRASTEDTNFAASLTSGNLTARIAAGTPWSIEFLANGAALTGSGRRGMGRAQTPDGVYSFADLSLGVGENVYGLGERFTSFVKNGQVVEIWNRDGGTNSDQAYKNIPFYLTNRGYGVFVNHTGAVSFELASEKADKVQFSVPGETIEYLVIYGPSPKEILEKYTRLTGRPALPPAWSFGLWLSTSFTTDYDEETVTGFIQGMIDRAIPLSVFHFDCFWMREFHWCDFQWDSRVFPDPPAMLKRLHDLGLRVCVWINPYISSQSSLFDEGVVNGYFLKRPDGSVWQTDQWQPGMAIVDFTNSCARDWFSSKLKDLLDMGVDAFKTDFGERIPTDVEYADGSDPLRMHNYYSYLYNKTVFDLLVRERGEGDAVVFARSGTAGSQTLPVHWGGDCESTFEAMAASLRGGLSFGLSGFGFWSHDIGGFEGKPPAPLYKRWVAFGLLSSHSRLHGSTSYRVPWVYDEEASNVLRRFTRLKCSLMPYVFAKAIEAHISGVPMMRAMLLEFPEDPACEYLDRQYMLGDSLLVAPIFSEDNMVSYYVPLGDWTNYLTNETMTGPGWRREEHGFESLPLLVRPGSIIAVGSDDSRPDYEYKNGVTLKIYQLADGAEATCVIPNMDGSAAATATAKRRGDEVTVELSESLESWRVVFIGQYALERADGAEAVVANDGIVVEAFALSEIRIKLGR